MKDTAFPKHKKLHQVMSYYNIDIIYTINVHVLKKFKAVMQQVLSFTSFSVSWKIHFFFNFLKHSSLLLLLETGANLSPERKAAQE